jgi:hypothetical protein
MNVHISIEPAFDGFVESIGGVVLKKQIGASPSFENADYVLHQQKIVAELKCLEDNKLDDPDYMAKIEAAWRKWEGLGYVTGEIPEQIVLNTLPPCCGREMVTIASAPLKGVIKKANRQIRETKDKLNLPTYKGLLLLANDGNYALPPNTLDQLVGGILSVGYTSINCYVLLSVNMVAQVPGVEIPCMVWMPSFRSEEESIRPEVMKFLHVKWKSYHERLTGQTYRCFGDVKEKEMQSPTKPCTPTK